MPATYARSCNLKSWNSKDSFNIVNMETVTANSEIENMKSPTKVHHHYKKVNFDPADTAKVQREMYSALKARREALEDIVRKKTEELKNLCIKEGELTGRLPVETPLAPGEEPPQIRRRVGTAFSLDANMVSGDGQDEDMSRKLELELELQKQITNAAHKLASDKSVSRFVRKQRRHSFIKAQSKLKEMEKKLSEYRKGDVPASPSMSGKYDGTYCAGGTDNPALCDDSFVYRPSKSRQNTSVAHRLSRSFREKNLLKYYKFVDSGISVKNDRNSSAFSDSLCLLDESRSIGSESRLEDSRSADLSLDMTENSLEESYKISNDSLYPSSYRQLPEESPLDMAFLTPPPAPKRREVNCMSPNTRRSKRASWHHTMFQKTSPQVPRANKETAV